MTLADLPDLCTIKQQRRLSRALNVAIHDLFVVQQAVAS